MLTGKLAGEGNEEAKLEGKSPLQLHVGGIYTTESTSYPCTFIDKGCSQRLFALVPTSIVSNRVVADESCFVIDQAKSDFSPETSHTLAILTHV